MADDDLDTAALFGGIATSTKKLETSARGFSQAMTSAFTSAVVGGKAFDEVLKGLALKLSAMAVQAAFKPLASGLVGGLGSLVSGAFGAGSGSGSSATGFFAQGGVKPFAAGGVIGTPSYFPTMDGGVGLAGEAGPEAIMPLRRGPDGRLGVAGGASGASVTVNIATPDAESFRRSESYVTAQIARAVARGRRGL